MMTEEDPWAEALEEQAKAESGENQEAEAGGEEDPWGDALKEQLGSDDVDPGDSYVSSDQLDENHVDLDMVLDIPVTISLEIGRTTITIRNLLSYTQGSVIELDRLAGEPLDILVNGTLIAHGEVVVVNDKFGVRLTDVISPQERLKKLT